MPPGPDPRQQLRDLSARGLYELGTMIGTVPTLAMPIARWRRQGVPLGPSTEVVIEGYPRSANTLMVETFVRAQPGGIAIAHHVHAPAHVLEAIRRGLPTIVLIREPEQAAVELAVAKPAIGLGAALRGWVRFYVPLKPHRSAFVLATHDEVHEDPAAPIRRLNERFGTSFALPSDVAREAAAQDVAERGYLAGPGPGLPLIGRTTRQGEEPAAARARLAERYRSAALRRTRRRAELLYRSLAEPG